MNTAKHVGPNLSQSVTLLHARRFPPESFLRTYRRNAARRSHRTENAGALRMDWPRVPLPADADTLRASAGLGATLAPFSIQRCPRPASRQAHFAQAYARSGFPQNAAAKPWRPRT